MQKARMSMLAAVHLAVVHVLENFTTEDAAYIISSKKPHR